MHHGSSRKRFLESKSRITFLDGLRGLAITCVLLFHAYTRWPSLVPYGATFAGFPPAASGWLGVELFFMISGFVILMTLEKCDGFIDFMLRRWLRLFPAMLLCTLLIFFTARFLPERPGGQPVLLDVLPGLALTDIGWGWIHPLPNPLDGSFWSLFVEVKFYAVFGAIYFLAGRSAAIWGLMLLFGLSQLPLLLIQIPTLEALCKVLTYTTSQIESKYFSWFAAGALFYNYFVTRYLRQFLYATLCGVIAALSISNYGIDIIAPLLIVIIFAVALISQKFQYFLNNRIFQFIGFVSYPLYLIHQNMMIAMIIKISKIAPWIPPPLLPLLPILLLIILSWIIAERLEKFVITLIHTPYSRFRNLIGISN